MNLVAYSTPKPVLQKLISRFGHLPAGQGVSFSQSYGPSGSQARAVVAGQPADVVFLSTGLDIDSLVDAGLVPKRWTKAPYGGIAADSVVAFVVRPGNPKHIHGWKDLLKPGVKVVTPNPFSSGSAKWNVLAAYGAMRKSGANDHKAVQLVTKLFQHVVSQDPSGSTAANTFFSGQGDVLITYESEAYAAFAAGKQGKLVVPKPTMLIQLPMVALKNAPGAAKAFIKYAHAPKQQRIFAATGYRPVVKSVLKRPDLAGWRKKYDTGPAFKIQDRLFGGWLKANRVWFDPNEGRMVGIERSVGGPTH
ncbi:MAG TPA: sulfate ABC transporter substrate-binding protein [Gaiellaceae bacterium]|nr:sulfate ABC transporter substrate-binding protein [Gaiellaceae bacterium]